MKHFLLFKSRRLFLEFVIGFSRIFVETKWRRYKFFSIYQHIHQSNWAFTWTYNQRELFIQFLEMWMKQKKNARRLKNLFSILIPFEMWTFQSNIDMHFKVAFFPRIFDNFQFILLEIYHIELLKMVMPFVCVYMFLLGSWLRFDKKLYVLNLKPRISVFPSIFDCIKINYSFLTWFACISVENNNHENIGEHHSMFDDAIVDWWSWGRVEWKQFVHWSMVKIKDVGQMDSVHCVCPYKQQQQRRKKPFVVQSSILGWWFFLMISYHTWHKNIVIFVQCSMCAIHTHLLMNPAHANNQSPKAMSHIAHNENESFFPSNMCQICMYCMYIRWHLLVALNFQF